RRGPLRARCGKSAPPRAVRQVVATAARGSAKPRRQIRAERFPRRAPDRLPPRSAREPRTPRSSWRRSCPCPCRSPQRGRSCRPPCLSPLVGRPLPSRRLGSCLSIIRCFASRGQSYLGLHRDIAAALAAMPDRDPQRPVALTRPTGCGRVLKRPNLAPCEQGDKNFLKPPPLMGEGWGGGDARRLAARDTPVAQIRFIR